ncbi:MAG: DnaB-like helicase C-terminal domain-containing protein [Halobacteriota archaeon]
MASKKQQEEYVPKETLKDVLTYPFKAIESRGITKATCEKFGVRVGLSQEDGMTVEAVYFPSYNQKGKVTGFKKQDLTKDKSEKYHWSTVGSVNIGNKLFGQDVAESVKRKRNNILTTEGEYDAMSCYQAMVQQVAGTKYEALEPFVVSIPLGTANAVESVLHNSEFVHSFDSLTIFFDDDYCTPAEKQKGIMKGHEAREAVASALVGSNLPLFVLTTPESYKDASDMLQDGKTHGLAQLCSFGKRAYSAEKIVKASDISFEELIEKRIEGLYIKCFPELMEKIHGFRTGELVLVTSPSGVGKSTVTSIFASGFLEAGERVGMIYLEETNKETLQRMIAAKLKVNYNKFKNDPLSCASVEDIRAAYDSIVENDDLVMLGHFGSLPITELMSKIKHMHLVEKCRYIILDHLSVVISGSDIANERKELDMVMTELAAFCAANDVCIIAVSHINRGDGTMFKAPKGKEDEPYWVKVTKEMMRGSAALEQLSFIIIGLEPEILPDRSRGRVRLTVLKNRPWSYLGVADEFSVDEDTWEVILSGSEEHDWVGK